MQMSLYPISKNQLSIAAGSFIDLEILLPSDTQGFYLKQMFCNKKEIGVELKDDTSSYFAEPLNMNFFAEDDETDFKIVFGPGTRLRVRLHNWQGSNVDNLSFALIGYKMQG